MTRISYRLEELRNRGEKALVTFITAGDPDLKTTEELIAVLDRSGADIIELGVPFSDPMADGPTIQLASERALAAGTTLPGILKMVSSVRQMSQIPLLLMGYFNPVLQYGLEQFAIDAAAAGVDGLLIVDLPPEESDDLQRILTMHGIDLIYLLTPTSDESRIRLVRKRGSGFLYYVSVTGVTGARTEISGSVAGAVDRIKGLTDLPLVVGFGVSTPEQAGQIALHADGVVVGSALVKLFEQFKGAALVEQLSRQVKSLKDGIRTVAP